MDFFKQHAQDFIAAAEDSSDGVTLIFTVLNPPGFSLLRQALRGNLSALSGISLQGSAPKIQVDVVAGYRHD